MITSLYKRPGASIHAVAFMTAIKHLDQAALDRLAGYWRAHARSGDRDAFGMAHALESEQHRRQLARVTEDELLAKSRDFPRAWWKFWQSRNAVLSMCDAERYSLH
jgi:hypothetical protein